MQASRVCPAVSGRGWGVEQANWNYPTRILAGAGRIAELPLVCARQGVVAPLLVTDPGIASLPLFQGVLAICQQANLPVAVFSNIKSNPTGDNVEAGARAFREGQHDGVIALGGGSALDAGKAIAVVARQRCSLWDLEDRADNAGNADPARIAPVIAIPTTAGTGSEVGRAALIVHEAQQRKVIVFHPLMMPVSVILDPELTVGLPPHLTAATGMDALSHSLEAWCSPRFHPMAEGIAMEGMRLVKEHLPTAVRHGADVEARLQMLVASMMGATAFQRGLGAMHALAHPLGAVYDAHHGLLNAVLMPYVLVANFVAIRERMGRLAACLGLTPTFDGFLEWILALRQEVGIVHTLAEVIDRDARFDDIGRMAQEDPSAATNPLPLTAAAYLELADRAYRGILR